MYYIKSLKDSLPVFKALSAPARIQIMELIYSNDMSMNDLAEALGLTNSAISLHVSKLEEAGLVRIEASSGKHGVMKLVKPIHSRLIVQLAPGADEAEQPCYIDDISVGHFSYIDAHPTCGICTQQNIIGELDDPRTFSYPERFVAGILWIGWGDVTYRLPNRLKAGEQITELQLSFEISSECPETNEDYPSDIYFYINDTSLGKWISPGDYGARKGLLSPAWWPEKLNQYGLLKTLIVNKSGTFIDGTLQISDITIDDLGLDYNSSIDFRLSVPKDTTNCGGLTLFGSHFGDYKQDIISKMYYTAAN